MCATLEGLPLFHESTELLAYIGAKANEVDTLPLLKRRVAEGGRVLVPVAGPDGRLDWCLLEADTPLEVTSFGILEPASNAKHLITPNSDALVLVPGVAFSRDGYRLGYGAGYYDRFLAQHSGVKVGLVFECCLAERLPVEAHDIPVDWVITEKGVTRCLS